MEHPAQTTRGGNPDVSGEPDSRRGFLTKALALALGGLAYAVPALAGVVAFLNPLRQKSEAGAFRRLASLDMLPEDGTPLEVSVVADRTDAWTRFANEPIGAVFLRRTGQDQIEALSVVCPHQGCSVQYEKEDGKFFCPCHMASFDLEGNRTDKVSPSPRPLDTLDVDQEKLQHGEVWVRYQRFRTGTPEKIVEA
jgi:menaquinol-cytochrome c reductase iron-sulfur subunit